MSNFTTIRPRDGTAAQQVSEWAKRLAQNLVTAGHTQTQDVDDLTPADAPHVVAATTAATDLVCYFGHGTETEWTTHGVATLDAVSATACQKKAVVSVACKTGTQLGSDAITAGAHAWLGLTIKLIVPAPYPYTWTDPFEDAYVTGLSVLGTGATMQNAKDALVTELDQLATAYDTGAYSGHPNSAIGYLSAIAQRDHLVLHGTASHCPL